MRLLEFLWRGLGVQVLPGRLSIDPCLQGTDIHVVSAGKLHSEPLALLFGDHLAARHKTNGHSPVVRLRRTNRKTLTPGGEF
jgi:hypothetical protein